MCFFVFSLVAFLIWWRLRTGFGLLTAFVLLGSGSNFMNVAIYSAELSATAVAVWELGAIIWPLFFLWLYLFPNGRAVPRRLLWIFMPLLSLLLFWGKDTLNVCLQWRYSVNGRLPDTLHINPKILMTDHITQANHFRPGNMRMSRPYFGCEVRGRFANNFQQTLHDQLLLPILGKLSLGAVC
jgi:hypothetical protein